MVNSKEYVTRVISSVVLFLAIYNLVDSKAPLTVTFKENENCFNLTAECEFDGDCCDPPGAEFGAECPRRSGVCSICSGQQSKCVTDVDCCSVLSCEMDLCCSPPGYHCQEDIDCCQGGVTKFMCAKTGSVIPGAVRKCRKAKKGEKPDLSKMAAIKAANKKKVLASEHNKGLGIQQSATTFTPRETTPKD